MNVGNRIRQARVSAGMSVQNVSATVGVSRNAVYKWERGEDVPRQSIIIKLARLFDVDTDFFFREVYVTMCTPAYRRKASLAKKAQDCVEARIALELEKQLFVDSLFPEREFPQFSAGSYRVWSMSDVEIAADQLRTSWGLGLDPIGSVISAVEEHGVRVVMIDGVEGFDGFSCFANGSMPVIAIPAGMPGDRQRFTLAHELGHMVLGTAPEVDEEKAAHRFAGAFLAPRKAVVGELGPRRSRLDIDELAILKRSYGMSMQAWARRAFDLGIIQREAYKSLLRTFSARGWRREEPGPAVPEERPTRTQLLARQAVAEGLLTPVAADRLLGRVLPSIPEVAEDQLAAQAAQAAAWYRSDPDTDDWIRAELGDLDDSTEEYQHQEEPGLAGDA